MNEAPVRPDRGFVLYWMISTRRTRSNFGLQRAAEWARELARPLVIVEALRVGYRWASARLHRFVLDGMAANRDALRGEPALFHPYVEPTPGEGRGLLAALGAHACAVVTDDFPCFFLPRMVEAAGARLDVLLEAVDSNGLCPLAATPRAFPTAYAFRRFLQRELPSHLDDDALPAEQPLDGLALPRLHALPPAITARWPAAADRLLDGDPAALAALAIDHGVEPVVGVRGGADAGAAVLDRFVEHRLARYAEERNQPDADAPSGLSPYLHFGHVAAADVLRAVAEREGWTPDSLGDKANGAREGWWNMSPSSEGFLDQLVTWRELGYTFAWHEPDRYDRFESLPAWALATLRGHAADARPRLYDLATLDAAATHDEVWNAAQIQLRREGQIHNYLRMLWGKKILEWSASPEEALSTLIELNNRYALDGRNPNSYSGIFWTLGRHDRPWYPERPIFGTVRYMSSDNARRKLRLKGYLATYAPPTPRTRDLFA